MHRIRKLLALSVAVLLHVCVLLLLLRGRIEMQDADADGAASDSTLLRFDLAAEGVPRATVKQSPMLAPAIEQPPELAADNAVPPEPMGAADAQPSGCREAHDAIELSYAMPMPTTATTTTVERAVDLSFLIGATGRALPEGISIERSSGEATLDEAAVQFALAHGFALPACDASATSERITYQITFRPETG